MKIVLIVATFFVLTGCKSEVDKCVESQVKGWSSLQERKEKMIKELNLNENLDKRTVVEVEAEARLRCLKASK
jgi:protein involved in sex pheromone biosynthesis